MTTRATIGEACQKLEWMAELSRKTCPPGVPEDPEAVRELLNQHVEDFLRQRRMRQWGKNDSEALKVRRKYRAFPPEWFEKSDLSDKSELADEERLDPYGIAVATSAVAANTLLGLANQGIYLLKRQLERLERDFVEQGGFSERLYRVRSERRKQQP